jgi:hypothetical protein
MNEKDESCSLCGSVVTHSCGEDFLCDRCCTNIMATPDELPWMFDWLNNIVLPYSIKMKLNKG